jgi:hypothetical protein
MEIEVVEEEEVDLTCAVNLGEAVEPEAAAAPTARRGGGAYGSRMRRLLKSAGPRALGAFRSFPTGSLIKGFKQQQHRCFSAPPGPGAWAVAPRRRALFCHCSREIFEHYSSRNIEF